MSWAQALVCVVVVPLACSTLVDPTIAVGAAAGGSGGELGAGAGGQPVMGLAGATSADSGGESGMANHGQSASCVELSDAGSRYWICVAPYRAHAAAALDCAERGAALAQISSAEENAFLASSAGQVDTLSNLWLGGTRDDEHVWRWPDGTLFWQGRFDGQAPAGTYVNWQQGEPNDKSTVTDEPERCAALALFDGGWRDRACSLELSYVCKAPASSP